MPTESSSRRARRHTLGLLRCVGRVGPVACLLTAVLSGCATTGDPTQGGLLGWSEAKARQRQADLTQESDAAQRNSLQAKGDADALRNKRDHLASESARQKKELDQLLAENADLDARLRTLMQQQRLSAAELARLQKVVADNDKVRRTLASPVKDTRQGPADTMGEQNTRLLREISILMQR